VISASKVIKAVGELSRAKGAGERWINPLGEGHPEGKNHFVLFLKPEVLAIGDGVDVEAILELVQSALDEHVVRTGAVRVLNGPYLGRYNLIEEHYGVINRAARLGKGALSESTRNKLMAECPDADRVLGGHEFLKEYPEVSAFALNIIADTLKTKKIASGKYYGVLDVAGERVVVLNPFHPQQVLHYTTPGRTIVVIECASDTDWHVLREDMTGSTDPAKAVAGSIRKLLLERKLELGLRAVGTATNGVHCSAGPLEAMVEFSRFFSDRAKKKLIKLSDTPFGERLARRGIGKKEIAALAKNPFLGTETGGTYAFNLTEEKNSDAAADLLAEMVSATTS
jgi:nucleoside diphosphate kinase